MCFEGYQITNVDSKTMEIRITSKATYPGSTTGMERHEKEKEQIRHYYESGYTMYIDEILVNELPADLKAPGLK